MANEVLLSTQFLAAAALFGMAIFLLVLQFGNRANRAFALLLVILGIRVTFNALYHSTIGVTGAERERDLFFFMVDHSMVAIPFAAANFALAYGVKSSRLRVPLRVVVAVAGLAALALSVLNRCLLLCPATGEFGPLGFLHQLSPLAFGLTGLFLIWTASREPVGACERAGFTVGAAFLLYAILDPGRLIAVGLQSGAVPFPGGAGAVAYFVGVAGILPAILGLVLAWRISVDATLRPRRTNLTALALLALLTSLLGLLIPWLDETATQPEPGPLTFLYGVWRIVLPGAIAYALLRHRLFDIDARVKASVVRGTVLFVFLALFFTVSKITENVLQNNSNLLLGGASAGLALLALSPLEKLGRRMADRLLPDAKPVKVMDAKEKLRLYADQAALIWRDGRMEAKERSILDHLRGRLGIPLEEAIRIEQAAASRSL